MPYRSESTKFGTKMATPGFPSLQVVRLICMQTLNKAYIMVACAAKQNKNMFYNSSTCYACRELAVVPKVAKGHLLA